MPQTTQGAAPTAHTHTHTHTHTCNRWSGSYPLPLVHALFLLSLFSSPLIVLLTRLHPLPTASRIHTHARTRAFALHRDAALGEAASAEANASSLAATVEQHRRTLQRFAARATATATANETTRGSDHDGDNGDGDAAGPAGVDAAAVLRALQREAEEARALAASAVRAKALAEAQWAAAQEQQRVLAGIYTRAAAETARADRLQAAVGFVDRVPHSALASTRNEDGGQDGDGDGDGGVRLSLEEQLEKAFQDVDVITGTTIAFFFSPHCVSVCACDNISCATLPFSLTPPPSTCLFLLDSFDAHQCPPCFVACNALCASFCFDLSTCRLCRSAATPPRQSPAVAHCQHQCRHH